MSAIFFLKGLATGFSIAAPVGPIGLLCIRRTLAEGRPAGLATGLGAATADALYGSIAGFGLTWIAAALVGEQRWLGLAGGAYLMVLGIRTFLAKPVTDTASPAGSGLVGAYASTFFLTLTNPMTILSFAACFAALGAARAGGDTVSAATFILGVFLGSASWWLTLSGAVSLFRSSFGDRGLRWMNRISGAVITGFGLWALLGTRA